MCLSRLIQSLWSWFRCQISSKLATFDLQTIQGSFQLDEWKGLHSYTMSGEDLQLVTNEPDEFEKQPVEVQDSREMTDHFRVI